MILAIRGDLLISSSCSRFINTYNASVRQAQLRASCWGNGSGSGSWSGPTERPGTPPDRYLGEALTMPRFEISDGAILALNGIASIADGAHALIAPQHFEDVHFGPKVLHPVRSYAPNEIMRYNGHAHVALGALTLAARNHLAPGGTRPFFNTSGAIFATAAGMAATNAYRGKQRKASGYTKAAVLGTVAALNLWRGLKRNDNKISV